jgi:hypothetical protein
MLFHSRIASAEVRQVLLREYTNPEQTPSIGIVFGHREAFLRGCEANSDGKLYKFRSKLSIWYRKLYKIPSKQGKQYSPVFRSRSHIEKLRYRQSEVPGRRQSLRT